MFEEEKKKPYPGDKDYQGGVFHTTMMINGQVKDVRVEKDAYGNVISILESNKIFGIF